MATTYTWAVTQMDCYSEHEGEQDVVFTVHWTLTGKFLDFTAAVYGSQPVTLSSDTPFTPYADLTENQVLGWVQGAMGQEQIAAYEANVEGQIADFIAPPVVTPPLPWASN